MASSGLDLLNVIVYSLCKIQRFSKFCNWCIECIHILKVNMSRVLDKLNILKYSLTLDALGVHTHILQFQRIEKCNVWCFDVYDFGVLICQIVLWWDTGSL